MEAAAGAPWRGRGRERLVAGARRVGYSTWFLGLVVFTLTWGGGVVIPGAPSIDASMQAGLTMAAVGDLDFGGDIVFTFGPLGFLKSYLVFEPWPTRLATLYGAALQLALALSLVWAIRRNFGALIAVALAAVIAVLCRGDISAIAVRVDAAVIAIAVVWCLAALTPGQPDWARKLVVYGGGPYAALEVLAKLNTGLIVLAIVLITAAALERDRLRSVAWVSGGFVGSFALIWFATGQGVGDLGDYVRSSVAITTGYSSGARLEWEQRDYDYALIAILGAATIAIAWLTTTRLGRRPRLAVLAITALVWFATAKGGIVSHDVFHMAVFYAAIAATLVAYDLAERLSLKLGVLAALAVAVAGGISTSFPGYPLANPIENLRNGASTVATMLDPGRLGAEIRANRASHVADYRVDARTLALLEGRTVHVEPSEAAVAWTYGLDWQPVPIFQPYAAWTRSLDERNARAFASADGPERILRQNLNALGRYPAYESPAAIVQMLCNFRATRTTERWQVLARVPDRCGEPVPIGSASGTFGEPIPVPPARPGSLVFGRARGVEVSGVERVRAALARASGRQVVFAGDPRPYTLVPGTAADGLILSADPRIDFEPPFALAPNAEAVTFLIGGRGSDEPISIDFYELPVRR